MVILMIYYHISASIGLFWGDFPNFFHSDNKLLFWHHIDRKILTFGHRIFCIRLYKIAQRFQDLSGCGTSDKKMDCPIKCVTVGRSARVAEIELLYVCLFADSLTYIQEDAGLLPRTALITVAGLGGIVAGYKGKTEWHSGRIQR